MLLIQLFAGFSTNSRSKDKLFCSKSQCYHFWAVKPWGNYFSVSWFPHLQKDGGWCYGPYPRAWGLINYVSIYQASEAMVSTQRLFNRRTPIHSLSVPYTNGAPYTQLHTVSTFSSSTQLVSHFENWKWLHDTKSYIILIINNIEIKMELSKRTVSWLQSKGHLEALRENPRDWRLIGALWIAELSPRMQVVNMFPETVPPNSHREGHYRPVDTAHRCIHSSVSLLSYLWLTFQGWFQGPFLR